MAAQACADSSKLTHDAQVDTGLNCSMSKSGRGVYVAPKVLGEGISLVGRSLPRLEQFSEYLVTAPSMALSPFPKIHPNLAHIGPPAEIPKNSEASSLRRKDGHSKQVIDMIFLLQWVS